MVLLVAVLPLGRDGRRRRQLHRARSSSTSCSLAYRRSSSASQFDRALLREMHRSGCRSCPSALALWAINFIDRVFVAWYKGHAEVGVYSPPCDHRVGDRLPDDRVPDCLARLRLLDRGRPRGQADVRLRADLPALFSLWVGARARRARPVVRDEPAHDAPAFQRAEEARRRCSPSPAPPTPATRCSRSAAAARGGRSSTGS